MILERLITLASRGAREPLLFWREAYKQTADEILPEVEEINLPNGTEARARLDRFIELLKDASPNEFALAQSLVDLSSVFLGSEVNEQITTYFETTRAFYNRAQTAELFRREREQLLGTLSPEQQIAQDVKLFQNEGMTYCLEFYLALYKAILDAPTDEAKRVLIREPMINLGFGGVPGLLADLAHDELLSKFIYKILADLRRDPLTSAYYGLKLSVSEYTSVQDVILAMKGFLNVLLKAFQEVGITNLQSDFFKPYGQKPKLSEIIF